MATAPAPATLEPSSARATDAGPPSPTLDRVTVLTGIAFFWSGAAALVYQVAWQRILALQSGAGIYSVAMIVGAFMAGLGLGSALGGALSTRVTAKRALTSFVWLELGIGAFGAVSATLYYDWLYLREWRLYESALRAGLLHFASLLVPTGLMGMSLPLLVRATVREGPRVGRTVGYLYAVNLLGAAVGALLTPWVLVRFFGIRGAVLAAALGNLAAACVALVAGRFSRGEDHGDGPDDESKDARNAGLVAREERPFGLWLLLYALSGFCALSLEMLWFRITDVAVRSTAFTFGTVLALYLLGNGVGSLLGTWRVARIHRPLRTFLLCQCLLLLYAGVAATLLPAFLADAPLYRELSRRFGDSGPYVPASLVEYLVLYAILPAVLFGPPTVLMGFSFPILQRGVHDDVRTSGRKVGFLQAANIAGCLLGSLLVGLVLLSALGTTGTLRAMLGVGVLFAGLGMRYYPGRVFAALATLLALLAFLLPGQTIFWLGLHAQRAQAAVVEEDGSGVVLITAHRNGWFFWSQGKRNSSLPYGGIHTVLGAWPTLVHPAPREVAIVGLGSGDTAWAAGSRSAISRIAVFEIVAPQLLALKSLAASDDIPELRSLLSDDRYEIRAADGRNAIDHGERLFDVIEIDALWPRSAYSGTLYSVEFFSRCARKLNRGGLMCTWAPTPRVRASFRTAFPYVLELEQGRVLLGSNDPIPLDVAGWNERLADPEVQAYLGRKRSREVADHLASARPASGPVSGTNRDLFPRDEFNSPQ